MNKPRFSISDYSKDLAAQFDLKANFPLTPAELSWKSNKKVWWKCNTPFKGKVQDDHRWLTSPDSRVQKRTRDSGDFTACPFCIGQRPSKAYNLATEYPSIAKEWHPTKNGELLPNDLTHGSTQKVWWQCLEDDSHEWELSPNQRTGNRNKKTGNRHLSGCIYCEQAGGGRKASPSYNLTTENKHLIKEWDFQKNGDLSPASFLPGAQKKVWWRCLTNTEHPSFLQAIKMRTSGQGCPECAKQALTSSKSEASLAFELSSFLKVNVDDHTLKCDNVTLDVDIICREKNLVIEYDGSFYHKDGESILRDIKKTELMERCGWSVIRVREVPLPKIGEKDVIGIKSCDYFRTACKVIAHLAKLGFISIEDESAYRSRKKLLKREELERYIRTGHLYAAGGQYPKPGRSKSIPEKALTVQQVLNWCDLYHERNGKYPGQYAKAIPEMNGDSFANINAALNTGTRGLPKKRGLAELLAQERGYIHNLNKPELTIERVVQELIAYYFANGEKFPTASNQELAGSLGCKWSAINAALHRGGRGLPAGLSLSKLRASALEKMQQSEFFKPTSPGLQSQ